MSIGTRELLATPYAAVAVNTTSLSIQSSEVIEIAVAVTRPGDPKPTIALDTLVRPYRSVGNTEHHGIHDEDLQQAPRFGEVAEAILAACANRVVVAHESQFVLDLLDQEFGAVDRRFLTPHLCTLRLDRALAQEEGAFRNRPLAAAAGYFGVKPPKDQSAREKALCVARVLIAYLERIKARQWRTFDDLRDGFGDARPKFLESFDDDLLPTPAGLLSDSGSLRPRRPSTRPTSPQAHYLEALAIVLADLHVDPAELASIARLRDELELTSAELRAVHARIFGAAVSRYCEDRMIDEAECENLQRLHEALRTLGWAPGDGLRA